MRRYIPKQPRCDAIQCKYRAARTCCLMPGEDCPLIEAIPVWLKFNQDAVNYIYKRTGVRRAKQTVKQYSTLGKNAYSGQRVYLWAIRRFGNQWYTTTKWIDMFIRKVSE